MGVFNYTRKTTVFGVTVAEVEIRSEYLGGQLSSKERIDGGSPRVVPINPSFIAPILVEAVKLTSGLVPERFQFESGSVIVVDGNIDAYSGVHKLKEIVKRPVDAAQIVFGTAALTNAYDKADPAAPGLFMSHLRDIIAANWEEIADPVK